MSDEVTAPAAGLEQTLKRCRPEVVQAALEYRKSKDARLLPTIVVGVLERYVEPERRGLLQGKKIDELRLQGDLGMDSLVMVEVVMTLEEILGESIPDTELRGLYTIGDTLAYVNAKATGSPLPVPPERLVSEMLPMILGAETPIVADVVLRANSAECVYSGAVSANAENLMQAAVQLSKIWAQRKESLPSFAPKPHAANLEVDATKPVALRIETEGGTKVWVRQTGHEARFLGNL